MGTTAPALAHFQDECLRLAPGTRSGGIAPGNPNQGGYHNSRNKLIALGKTGDYSLRYASDKKGNADRWRAFDWVFPDAQNGNYSTIRHYMTRIKEAYDRRDPLLTGWREALGQQDADGNPEGFDFVGWYTRTPDDTHMWHIHFSIMNEYVDEVWPYNNMLTILFGEAQSMANFEDIDKQRIQSVEYRVHKALQRAESFEGDVFQGHYDLPLIVAFNEMVDDVAQIKAAVAALGEPTTITQEMLNIAVQNALAAIPEAE